MDDLSEMDVLPEPESEPRIAQRGPYAVELEAEKTHYWCQCGRSKTQPFCDGSHAGTDFQPKVFTVTETKTYYLCGCKHTGNGPFCDGSHDKIDG